MFNSIGLFKLSNNAGYKLLYASLSLAAFLIICEQNIVGTNDDNNIKENLIVSNLLENNFMNNDDDGGWNDSNNDDELFNFLNEDNKDNNKCTIERVDGTQFRQEDFLTNYAYSHPIIITNVTNNAFKSSFKKLNLLNNWSDFPVVLASANTYSYSKVETTFGTYINKYLKPLNDSLPANETYYLFGDIDQKLWKPLLNEYNIPKWYLPEHEAALSFGVAAIGTGVPFHFHGPGFAEVIFGAKRWFLYPFEKRPKWDPNVSTLKWMKQILVKLPIEEKPLECILVPGELIYFPDKWWHATLNVKTSVFFSTFLSPSKKIKEEL